MGARGTCLYFCGAGPLEGPPPIFSMGGLGVQGGGGPPRWGIMGGKGEWPVSAGYGRWWGGTGFFGQRDANAGR